MNSELGENDTSITSGVIGHGPYSDLSLICAAAAHTGVIDDLGVSVHN